MRRALVVLAAIAAAALAIPSALADAPVLSTPGNVNAEATSASGASVSFDVTSSDPTATPSCTPSSGSTFSIGSTTVECTATNKDGETGSASFTVNVSDTTPPSISTPGDLSTEATSASGATVSYSASASDAVSGSLTPSCAPASGSTFPLGATTVTCTASDGAGHSASASFTVNVLDTAPPTVSAPADQSATTTSAAGTAVSYPGATASDTVDGSIAASCSPASGSVFPVGSTTVTCTATDAHSNSGSASFTVTVTLVDTTPPVVTVPGAQSAEASSGAGAAVSFSASAVDNVDGSLGASCSPGSGSTFSIGTTNVTCSATDAHGNTGSGSFTVTVKDTTAPGLTLPGNISATASSSAGAAVSFSASASDTVDGGVTPSCSPASGSTFGIGTTTVTCTATDSHGNKTSGGFSVVVSDASPPTVTVPGAMKLEADGASGAVATYAVSATDSVDGGLPASAISCTKPSGSTFPLGKTTVTCSATDHAGNTGSASFTVEVVDTQPPTLNVPGPTTVTAGPGGLAPSGNGAVAAFLGAANARDRVDGSVPVTSDAPAGFGVGAHTVTFTARDRAGNATTKRATLNVLPTPASGSGSSGSGTVQTTSRPTAPDATPPGEVSKLVARSLNHAIALSWALPPDRDFDHVEVEQTVVDAPTAVLYRGSATSFTVKGLANGFRYRFVVVTFDKVGNASLGAVVTGTPVEQMLVRPADGSRVKAPATFVWKRVAGALYYNIQVFRLGSARSATLAAEVKVLSAWPVTTRFVLGKTWTFQGRRQKLAPGTYRWYIWPGVGPRSRGVYGQLLGSSTFVVPR